MSIHYRWHNAKEIVLPDGTKTDTWSKEYMLYCEALNLSKKPTDSRRQFVSQLKNKDRVDKINYWLQIIWKEKASL
jgi:hypothetical protein